MELRTKPPNTFQPAEPLLKSPLLMEPAAMPVTAAAAAVAINTFFIS